METIEEMVKRGRATIEAREVAAEAAREEEVAQRRADWATVQAEVRLAFAEVVREYVFLEETADYPVSHLMRPEIRIPGYSPIELSAAREPAGEWRQVHNKDRWGKGGLYNVTAFYRDYEFGDMWLAREGVYTDSLEEALAYAKRFGDERTRVEQAKQARTAEVHEAEYLPVLEETQPGLMDQLVGLIRDVAREEIARSMA